MAAKVLFLIMAVVIISALSLIAIMKVWDVTHEAIANRKLRKLNEKLDQLEGN